VARWRGLGWLVGMVSGDAWICAGGWLRGVLQAKGVITASAGNHAQGVAMSAARLGVSAIVAMPTATPSIKVNNVRRLGAQVELVGDTFDGTAAWAREQSETQGRPYIPPFDHPDTIAGQGTIAMEIFNQTDRWGKEPSTSSLRFTPGWLDRVIRELRSGER
jgi:threonine dehydratase